MPSTSDQQTTQPKGLLGNLGGLLSSAKDTLDTGIKTNVTVTFPRAVYFNIFALVVFCTVAIIGLNMAAKAVKQ